MHREQRRGFVLAPRLHLGPCTLPTSPGWDVDSAGVTQAWTPSAGRFERPFDATVYFSYVLPDSTHNWGRDRRRSAADPCAARPPTVGMDRRPSTLGASGRSAEARAETRDRWRDCGRCARPRQMVERARPPRGRVFGAGRPARVTDVAAGGRLTARRAPSHEPGTRAGHRLALALASFSSVTLRWNRLSREDKRKRGGGPMEREIVWPRPPDRNLNDRTRVRGTLALGKSDATSHAPAFPWGRTNNGGLTTNDPETRPDPPLRHLVRLR